jgi:hypothetical protein
MTTFKLVIAATVGLCAATAAAQEPRIVCTNLLTPSVRSVWRSRKARNSSQGVPECHPLRGLNVQPIPVSMRPSTGSRRIRSRTKSSGA